MLWIVPEEIAGWDKEGWFSAVKDRVLTPEERLCCVLRVLTREKVQEVVVYEHGTVVVVLAGSSTTAEAALSYYDTPYNGEGSPLGDIITTPIDDGSVLFPWCKFDDKKDIPGAVVVSVLGAQETVGAIPIESASEVFIGRDVAALRAGLAARDRRLLDARERKPVTGWRNNTV